MTELHRLDEAEAKYHEALKLDPNDQKSKNELEYILARSVGSAALLGLYGTRVLLVRSN